MAQINSYPDATETTGAKMIGHQDGTTKEVPAALFADADHDHAIADVTGLQSALDGKAPASHTHAQSDITDLVGDLAAKADTSSVTSALDGKANTSHTHAQSDVTNLVTDLAGKAASSHTHAQSDITNLTTDLAGKAATSHTQAASTITDFNEAVDDRVAALLVEGANVTLTYNDVAGTLTIAAAGGGGGTADDYEVVTASNPTSPYTASGLTGHTVIKVTGLAGNLTINKPTGTFGAGQRFFVIYEVTASGGDRTLTFGTGIALGLGIAPSLVVASGVTNRYVLYTDDDGSTFVYDGDAAAATDTVAGPVELATAAETTGGTDATRAVTPDGLAGSVYGIRYAALYPVGGIGDDIATGDGQSWFDIPVGLNGWNLVSVIATVGAAGTTGTTDFQVRRVRAGTPADMLSTKSTIDSGETSSATAATPAVINTSNDDVATGDRIYLDVDAVSSTPPKGGCVTLGFQAP